MLGHFQSNVIGNLCRDVELKYTASNTAVVNNCLAVNADKDSDPIFLDVTFWGRSAEVLAEYCNKGSRLFVAGRMTEDKWDDKDGNKRKKLILTCEKLVMLGERRADQGGEPAAVHAGNAASESLDDIDF